MHSVSEGIPTTHRSAPGMAWKAGVAISCRLVLNTARRFAYPFAPVLSRGLKVPLTAVTLLIAINQATAIPGIVFGPLADRLGYRLMMLCGLGMLAVGMLTGGFLPVYWVVMAAVFFAGLGKTIFDPAIQAYVSERVPFQRRGLVIGFLEFSWAGSTLVGIPLLGLVIEGWGWRAAFFVLGGLGLLGFWVLRFLIPKGPKNKATHRSSIGLLSAWRQLGRERTALGAIGFAFFISVANDNLFVVYGAWLEKAFSLSVVALGLGTGAIGVAELLGEILTAALADRFGLKRSVILGLSLCLLCYGILPLLGNSISIALAGLFAIFLTFEFTIVSFLSLCTELLPGSRATMMSSYFAAAGMGRILGALVGGPVWVAGGIVATSSVSVVISTLALAALMWGLKGWVRQ
jgi:predicted MFS family arabinose efflux permease